MSDQFISPESPPEGLERELLTILAEECCEVGQRVSKALRFGLAEIQPGQPLNNAERISQELGDVQGMVEQLIRIGVLDQHDIDVAADEKFVKLAKYLQSEGPKA